MKSRVHPTYKTQYHVQNWAASDRALVCRGDITIWLSPAAIAAWEPDGAGTGGAQRKYSDLAIESALTLRLLCHLPLRQTAGCLTSLFVLRGLDLRSPDHTTLSRRGPHLDLRLRGVPRRAGLHLIIDSTGRSIAGAGAWATAKHGGRGTRGWKTRPVGVDHTGVIVAHARTDATGDDAPTGVELIEAVNDDSASVTADAASDTVGFYDAAGARGAPVVVPPPKTARVSRRRPRVTNRMTTPPDTRKVIVGVDTHTHVHVAVAIDSWGIRLRDQAFVADSGGYQALITWAETHGRIEAFGIEGTGSYGAGLARAVRRARHRVVEVNRGDRRTRRAAGKSDTIDAEVAARSVLAGQSTAIPKTADGAVKMMRQLKITRDTAVKARTMAMNTLKQIIVHAPPVLREALHDLTDHGLLTRCAGLRPGPIDTPTASAKHTLRALARRWMALTDEIAIHDQHLARLTTETSPTLREGFGVGAHTAAELLILFGDNPDRIRSDAAFAKLCGACPIPASSGMTTGRHRLNRGGHRQANAALYRAVIVRMRFHQPTRDYVARRTADGRTKREIIRCLKRFLAREIYQRVMTDFRTRQAVTQAA